MNALLIGNEMKTIPPSRWLILGEEFLNNTYSFFTGICTVVSN